MKVALIPARGGSKRIPKKNIRMFSGKPIIAWSIECALKSDLFDKIIVSTDCDEIAKVAIDYGAEVPFKRPQSISGDFETIYSVVKHSINELKLDESDYLCCLFATAPFVRINDIKKSFLTLDRNKNYTYCFSATSYSFPIHRSFYFDKSGAIQMFYPEHQMTRSQDLTEAFHDAGQFYWGRVSSWRNSLPIFSPNSQAFLIPRYRVQDIDTEEDWIRAENLFGILMHDEKF